MVYLVKYTKTYLNENNIPIVTGISEEEIDTNNYNELIEIFNNKNKLTENTYFSINEIIELQEFLVCYTNVFYECKFGYCDISDELIYALNKEDAKRKFYLQFPNTEYTKNHIDKIFSKEEFTMECNKYNN